MTIKVRCPRCGKASAYLSADGGLTALCIACGQRYVIPKVAAGEGVEPAMAPPIDGRESQPAGQVERLNDVSVRPPVQRREGRDVASVAAAAGHRAVFWGVVGGGLAVVATLVVVLILATRPTWEERNRPALRDLKVRADAFAMAGRNREAVETYDELLRATRERPLRDPRLLADLELAKSAREKLFARLVAESNVAMSVQTPASSRRDTVAATVPVARDAGEAQAKAVEPIPAAARPMADEDQARSPDGNPAGGNPLEALSALIEYYADPIKYLESRANGKADAAASVRPSPSVPPPTPMPAAAESVRVEAATRPGLSNGATLTVRRVPPPPELVTDEEIGRSIQRGVDWMISNFHNGKLISANGSRSNAYHSGLNALCVYSLLQSSYAIKDERLNLKGEFIRSLVSVMKELPMDMGPVTYARAIRATALALIDRREDRAVMSADVKYLLDSHISGAYTYQSIGGAGRRGPNQNRRSGPWDNSNSQYGLLGVWSGAEVGAEVNGLYWQAVDQHWTKCQLPDGSWGYSGYGEAGSGRLSMSVAGIASLFVTHDYLDAPRYGAVVGRAPFSPALKRGLEWLETENRAVEPDSGYTLYGIERVGLASGFKFLGDHDWYRVLARRVIDWQQADGSWGNELETAYHLLFLARGRHPILMNKLRFEGSWANRPRDAANLARFASRELERPLNWQIVPLDREWTEWTDSPILYVASHTPPKFNEQDLDKIRSFVAAGGLLFTQADGGKVEVDQWATEVAAKIFRPFEMQDLPADHEIFSLHYRIAPEDRPRLRYVSNGSRILMVHSPEDLSQHWQLRQDKSKRAMFELGVNLFLYASGKADLRNRLTSSYIPPLGAPAAGGVVNVVRLRYAGNWNPEPMAWTRFSRYLQLETDVGINLSPLEVADLPLIKGNNGKTATVAHLTGTHAHTFTDAQVNALREFVEAGGMLVIDPCGGGGEFLDSARVAIGRAFPGARLASVNADHPLLGASGPGMQDLANPQVRPYVKVKSPGILGRVEVLFAGRGTVIVSPLDLTTGVLGANTWGVHGFEPAYASALMKNVLLWAAGAHVKSVE